MRSPHAYKVIDCVVGGFFMLYNSIHKLFPVVAVLVGCAPLLVYPIVYGLRPLQHFLLAVICFIGGVVVAVGDNRYESRVTACAVFFLSTLYQLIYAATVCVQPSSAIHTAQAHTRIAGETEEGLKSRLFCEPSCLEQLAYQNYGQFG
jgi:hypothetical protein